MVKTFEFDPHDTSTVVAEAIDFIDDYLSRLRMSGVEQNRCMLMFEESLVTLLEHVDAGRPQKVTVRTRHLFGTLTIMMSVAGQEFPFTDQVMSIGLPIEEEGEDD